MLADGGEEEEALTLAALQAAVVPHGAEEFEDEDGHGDHGEAHDEHHHPHGRTVGLCEDTSGRDVVREEAAVSLVA